MGSLHGQKHISYDMSRKSLRSTTQTFQHGGSLLLALALNRFDSTVVTRTGLRGSELRRHVSNETGPFAAFG